jgi:hypothetical protein
VRIASRNTLCPLCGAALELKDAQYFALPQAFAKREKLAPFSGNLFDKIYFAAVIIALIAAFSVEFVLTKRGIYSLIALSVALYFYFLIRGTIKSSGRVSQKILWQAVVLTGVALLISRGIEKPSVVYDFVLPVIFIASLTAEGICILSDYRRRRVHIVSLFTAAILAFIPLLISIEGLAYEGMTPSHILAIFAASYGAAVIILSFILISPKIKEEIKRFFHV